MPKSSGPVRTSRHDRVFELRLDRPAARNAFSRDVFERLAEAVLEADQDGDVAAVLVTAAGPVFSAGWDRDELAATDPAIRARTSTAYRSMMTALESCSIPVIASVNGAAVGIGFTLLGHCDLVVIGHRARFRAPFALLGLVPEAGSTALLPARVGPHLTAELMFTGRWLGADEAIAAGLGVAASRPHKVDGSALELAQRVAEHPREALRRTKELLRRGRTAEASAARVAESAAFRDLHAWSVGRHDERP